MAGERMLSTGQTEKRLGISVRRIYRWEAAGRLVPISRLPGGQHPFSSRDYRCLAPVKGTRQGTLCCLCPGFVREAGRGGQPGSEEGSPGGGGDGQGIRGRDHSGRAGVRPASVSPTAWRLLRPPGSGSRSWTGRWRWMRPEELVADMLAIVTCCAARLYGSRSQQFRQKVKAAAKEAEGLAG